MFFNVFNKHRTLGNNSRYNYDYVQFKNRLFNAWT